MTFFESLLALLLAAILLLQVSRRVGLPYPAMLAAAGVVVALIPGAPTIAIEPATALALFISPALIDAAFDFPLGAARKLWVPLVALALVAVVVTAGFVAWLGWAFAGLPLAAAVTLGAIVAPPDAAAATAVLGSLSIPRGSDAVLKGESLFNDATALLLFSAALQVQSHGGLDTGVAIRLALAAPGGVLLGIGSALAYRRIDRFVTGTLGGSVLQFVNGFVLWIVAERLHLSAVLSLVAFAMTIARSASVRGSPRMRVHSYAVWSTVVFLLNVLAFLLMGMQARTIVGRMPTPRFHEAAGFAAGIVFAVIVIRLAIVLGFNRWSAWRARRRGDDPPATVAQGMLVGWSGMRGLLTLATSFALPADFPQRDLLVLTAFAVVLATLVVQGVTLAPLIRLLGLDQHATAERELAAARVELGNAALATLDGADDAPAEHLRYGYRIERDASADTARAGPCERHRDCGLAAVAAERERLEDLRTGHRIGAEAYIQLQEEIDWRELSLLPAADRRIEES